MVNAQLTKRRSLVQLVQAGVLPMLIATVFGLTAWYAVSGYLGSYQGGKLWVAASGDAVEEAHAAQLASMERRARALLQISEPTRSLGPRESFVRLADRGLEHYGASVTPGELPSFEALLRGERHRTGEPGVGEGLTPRGVMWREGRLFAVVVAVDEEARGVLLSEVTSAWLEHDRRLTAAEVCFWDREGVLLATTYLDTDGAPLGVSFADIADSTATDSAAKPEPEYLQVSLSAPYRGAQQNGWHEGESQFSVFSQVIPMRSPTGEAAGTVWIMVPEDVMLGWTTYGMVGTAFLGIIFGAVMLLLLRRRITSVISPIDALSEKVLSIRAGFEAETAPELNESTSHLKEAGSSIVADELWRLSQGITQLEHQVARNRVLEGQLRHAQKMEAVGTLAGGIAHDFNNLLSVIVLNTEVLLDGLADSAGDANPHLNYEDAELLEEVLASSEHGKALTTQLLGMSGGGHESTDTFGFQESAADVVRMMRRLIPESITVRQALEGPSCKIRGDKNSFAQVLMNLVLNARDALDDSEGEISILGGVRDLAVSLECTEGVLAPGSYAVLSVVDTGVGISEDKLSSIFEPFATSKGHRGTGLGLTVVRHAVLQRLGGAITIVSEQGKGTQFDVFFPIVGAEDRVDPEVEATLTSFSAIPGERKLALVEDNEGVRASLERVLITTGHDVLSFESGSKLLAWANQNEDQHIDLLITDVVMPGLSGPKTYREFEALRPGVQVLFISGYAGAEFKDFEYADAQILQKPVSREELLARIQALLG